MIHSGKTRPLVLVLVAVFVLAWFILQPASLYANTPLTVSGLPSTINVQEWAYFTITGGVITQRKPGYTPYTIISDNKSIIGWSYSGGDTYSIFAYAPGTITLTIKDQGGNTKSFKITAVTAPFALEAPSKIQYRSQDFFYVKIKRGTAPYTITISDPSVLKQSGGNPNVTNDILVQVLKPGVATITVRDSAGKQTSAQIEIVDPTAGQPLNFGLNLPQPLKTNIGYALSPQGGKPPYSYSASPANLNISANGTMIALNAGTYTVTVRDSAGAQISKSFTFVNNDAIQGLQLTLSANKVKVGETVTLKVAGGTPPYTVTAPVANLSVSVSTADTFILKGVASSLGSPVSVQVKDSQGRGAYTQLTVVPNENQAPQAKFNANEIYVGEAATLTVSNGTPPYNVSFDNTDAVRMTKINDTTYRFDGLKAGLANITVRDGRNLPAFTFLRVKEKPQPTVPKLEAVITSPELNLSGVGSVRTLTVWGGKEPYTITPSNSCVSVSYYGVSTSGAKQYIVSAKQRGTAVIKISDSSGQVMTINVTVK